MKKAIVFVGMACLATSALAFGGGGGGQSAEKYNRHNPGVDNFGVHIHPDNPPLDIRFYDIKDDENAKPCQDGANVYCCKEGYIVDVATSKCVPCPSGSVATLDENFKCTVCTEEEGISLDKTACCDPADATCMNPNKECHPDYLENCEENSCESVDAKWCSGTGKCIALGESCECEGFGNGCQMCDNTGAWVADEAMNGQACGDNENTVCSNGICVCPHGGELIDGVCCKNGAEYDAALCEGMTSDNYCKVNIPVCGCANGSTPSATGTGCCYNYPSSYDEGFYGYWSFAWNNAQECNDCGYGQYVEKNGVKYCCGAGSSTSGSQEVGPYDISNCEGSACSNPESYGVSQTQVCCEKSGMKWCASTNTCVSEQASCQCVGEGEPCQKCDSTTGEWVADETLNGKACGEGLCYDGTCNFATCQTTIAELNLTTDGRNIAPHCCAAAGGKSLYGYALTNSSFETFSTELCCWGTDVFLYENGTVRMPPLSDCLLYASDSDVVARCEFWLSWEYGMPTTNWAERCIEAYENLHGDQSWEVVYAEGTTNNGIDRSSYCICDGSVGVFSSERNKEFCDSACSNR